MSGTQCPLQSQRACLGDTKSLTSREHEKKFIENWDANTFVHVRSFHVQVGHTCGTAKVYQEALSGWCVPGQSTKLIKQVYQKNFWLARSMTLKLMGHCFAICWFFDDPLTFLAALHSPPSQPFACSCFKTLSSFGRPSRLHVWCF